MKTTIQDKLKMIDKDHYSLLLEIGNVASELKLKAYLVGGMVRDLLLGFDNLDIDIVVESNALLLAEALTKRFSYCKLSAKHDRFHTAKVIFDLGGKKIPVDLASTRQEIYEYPASLPKVTVSDLKKDLYRRDFTINALAVSLMPDEFGEVVDLFDGLIDLKNKKIRVLHDLSFVDDPTRMIRAVRFAAKLGFEIEEYTEKLLNEVIDSKQFDNLIEKIRGDRVKIEIRYLFNLPCVEEAIKIFFESGIYRMISTELEKKELASWRDGKTKIGKQWLVYFGLILQGLPNETTEKILNNLQLTAEEIKIIKGGFTAYNRLQTLIKNSQPIDSVIIFKEFKDLSQESILIVKFMFQKSSDILSLIDEYNEKTSKIKLEITGQDLVAMGILQGKAVGEILQKVLERKIKDPSMKKEDEIKLARTLTLYVIFFLLTI